MAHQVLPGSMEVDGNVITAGVHVGPTEWEPVELKYVRLDIDTVKPEDKTVPIVELLGRLYDANECVITVD